MPDWTLIRQAVLDEDSGSKLSRSIKIPSLPESALEFSRKAEDPNASIQDLARIVEADSGMTVELLKSVNASAVGRRYKASSAQEAIIAFGIRKSKLALLTAAIQNSIDCKQSKVIVSRSFWNVNLERGLLAREVAQLCGADPDIAFTGAVLQDFLLPALTAELYEFYLAFIEQQKSQSVSLAKFEEEAGVCEHAKEAAQLMVGWNFPDEVVCCVLYHHLGLAAYFDEKLLGNTSVAAVAVSALMPDPLGQDPAGLDKLFRLDRTVPEFQLLDLAAQVHDQFLELSPAADEHVTLLMNCEKALAVQQ